MFFVLKSKYWVKSNGVWHSTSKKLSTYYYDIKEAPNVVMLSFDNRVFYFIDKKSINFTWHPNEVKEAEISYIMRAQSSKDSALYEFYEKYGFLDRFG